MGNQGGLEYRQKNPHRVEPPPSVGAHWLCARQARQVRNALRLCSGQARKEIQQ
jgi:hypothetical protein